MEWRVGTLSATRRVRAVADPRARPNRRAKMYEHTVLRCCVTETRALWVLQSVDALRAASVSVRRTLSRV